MKISRKKMFYNVDTCLPFNFGSHYSELPFVVACLRIYSNSVQYKCYLNPALKMGQTMYLFCFFCLFSNKYRSSTHSMAFTRAITQKKFTRFSKQLSILGFFFIHCWSFSNKQYNLLQQMNVKKCPSSIRCLDTNTQLSEHESHLLTTRPMLRSVTDFIVYLKDR